MQTGTGAGPDFTVLYVGGEGRSGSTLLGRLAGEIEGWVNVGEIGYVWYQCFPPTNTCGCSAAFQDCSFWREVIQEAFGGFDRIDIAAVRRGKEKAESARAVPSLLSPWLHPETQASPDIRLYLESMRALYRAIADISGAKVIVDGSKSPLTTYFLERTGGVDLRVVHLVRDSRAVCYSWQRSKVDPSTSDAMMRRPPIRAALRWLIYNDLTWWLRPSNSRYRFMRYEDFIADPATRLLELCRWLGQQDPVLPDLSDREISLSEQHTANGNPDRFQRRITIRMDSEWQTRIDPRQRRMVTLLTLPLLIRYGYWPNRSRGR